MTHMTPKQAQHVLNDNISPPEPGAMTYYAQSFRALTALAADTLEYKVETLYNGRWREPNMYADYYWTSDYYWAVESLAGWQKEYPDEQFRLVARRVSPEWVVTDE